MPTTQIIIIAIFIVVAFSFSFLYAKFFSNKGYTKELKFPTQINR